MKTQIPVDHNSVIVLKKAVSAAMASSALSLEKPSRSAVLNEISKSLGYSNYRALLAASQKSSVSKVQVKEMDAPLDFEHFCIVFITSDESVSQLRVNITPALLKAMMSGFSGSDSPSFSLDSESYFESNESVYPSVTVHPGVLTQITASAEVCSKHFSHVDHAMGSVNLNTLLSMAKGALSFEDAAQEHLLLNSSDRTLYVCVEGQIPYCIEDEDCRLQARFIESRLIDILSVLKDGVLRNFG